MVKELARKIRVGLTVISLPRFPVSGDENIFLLPGDLSHGNLYDLFQARSGQ